MFKRLLRLPPIQYYLVLITVYAVFGIFAYFTRNEFHLMAEPTAEFIRISMPVQLVVSGTLFGFAGVLIAYIAESTGSKLNRMKEGLVQMALKKIEWKSDSKLSNYVDKLESEHVILSKNLEISQLEGERFKSFSAAVMIVFFIALVFEAGTFYSTLPGTPGTAPLQLMYQISGLFTAAGWFGFLLLVILSVK